MKTVTCRIEGITPLLHHAATGLDPTHPLKKEAAKITAKRGQKKTDAELAALDWIDFQLSIYHNGDAPFVPGLNVEAVIRAGATAQRKGKDVLAGVAVMEDEIPLIYEGPRGVRDLYDAGFVDRRRATVQRQGVMRTRPIFRRWALEFTAMVDDKIVNVEAVREATEYAGMRVGLLDFRPRFGRFQVVSWRVA